MTEKLAHAKIKSLTAAQVARLPEFRDRWLSIGLSTETTNRAMAEVAVDDAYALAGLKPPQVKIWLASPLAGIYAAAMVSADDAGDQVGDRVWGQVRDQVRTQLRNQVGNQLWNQLWNQVGDQVVAQVGDQVRNQVWNQVRDQVWAQVRSQVRDQVWAQVRSQVWAQVGDQVWNQGRDPVMSQVYRAGYGLHDAGWLGFYDYVGNVLGLECATKLRGIMDLAQSCGWWWPFAGAVIMTEKPVELHRDAAGRLHCENDVALKYSDGFGLYRWHGLSVPEDVIRSPEAITIDRIQNETNVEVRRVLIERYGVDRYVGDMGAEVIHQDLDPLGHPRRLLRAPVPGDDPVVIVEYTNSTPEPDGSFRQFHTRCHPELRPIRPLVGSELLGKPQALTAHNAIASLYGLCGEEYAPDIET